MLTVSAIQHSFEKTLLQCINGSAEIHSTKFNSAFCVNFLKNILFFSFLIADEKCYLSHEFSEFFRRQKVSDVMAACCGLRQLESLVRCLLHLGLAGFVFPGATLF
jgi:hypothetical protein